MPVLKYRPGLQLHYLDLSPTQCPVILLLHGLGADASSWRFQFQALQQCGFRVLAPDIPGFGLSPFSNRKATIADIAQDIHASLDLLGCHSLVAVGISMGGTIALQLALDYPQLISRLVLINTFARLDRSNLRTNLYLIWRWILVNTLGLPTQAKTVAQHVFPKPEQAPFREELIKQIKQANPAGYRAMMRALAQFDVENRLANLSQPTLVISGENDRTIPLEVQIKMARKIPQASHVIISEAGHAVTVEQPDRINAILLDFLSF